MLPPSLFLIMPSAALTDLQGLKSKPLAHRPPMGDGVINRWIPSYSVRSLLCPKKHPQRYSDLAVANIGRFFWIDIVLCVS